MKRLLMVFTFICLMFAVPAYAETEQPANNLRYTTTSVNIRKEPSLEGEIIRTVPRNTEIIVIREIDDFWTGILEDHIDERPAEMVYIASQYLSIEPIIVDQNDLYWLAHAINGEMQGESFEDHLYTGSVILNRVKSSHYPNTIESVITDRKWGIQYMCYWDGNFQKTPTQEAWDAATYLLTNGSVLPDNVLFQAEFKQGNGVYVHTKAAYYCIW